MIARLNLRGPEGHTCFVCHLLRVRQVNSESVASQIDAAQIELLFNRQGFELPLRAARSWSFWMFLPGLHSLRHRLWFTSSRSWQRRTEVEPA